MEREYNEGLKGPTTPTEIAEYLKKILPELGDVDAQELLIQQESAYEGIRRLDYGYGESSNHNLNDNFDDDEAIARALMMSEKEIQKEKEKEKEPFKFNHLHISPPASPSPSPPLGDTRSNVTKPPVAAGAGKKKINEQYEQLQSPGDAVGHTSKYKVGPSKENEKMCVICCAEFEEGDNVTTLPCAHYYHSDCITKSLQFKKACPVCQKEVKD